MLRIHKASAAALLKNASKEPGRYAMHCVQLETPESGAPDEQAQAFRAPLGPDAPDGCSVLIATDGRRLVALPVETVDRDECPMGMGESLDTGGLVSREVLETLAKGPKGARPYGFLEANGKAIIREGGSLRQELPQPNGTRLEMDRGEIDGEFPTWRAIVPEGDRALSFCVNATYLAEVMAAVSGGKRYGVVRIFPSVDGKPIRVEGCKSPLQRGGNPHPGAVGVVMPITIDD